MPSIKVKNTRISKLFDKDGNPIPEQKTLKILQRLYKLSTNSEALSVLMNSDIHSAYEISKMSEKQFVIDFKNKVGGEAIALKIYTNAKRVNNLAKNKK